MQIPPGTRWNLGRSISPEGEGFYFYVTRYDKTIGAEVKVILNPNRSEDEAKRIVLCVNALMGVPDDQLKAFLDAQDSSSVFDLLSEASRKRTEHIKNRLKIVGRSRKHEHE